MNRNTILFISSLLLSPRNSCSVNGVAQKSALVSTGLRNLGNSCYMNAQLECAFHIPRIREIVENSGEENMGALSLKQLFTDMEIAVKNNNGFAAAPIDLCRNFDIPVMEQQDSQEFWKLLLPALKIPELTDLYQGSYEDYITAADGTKRERRREEPFLDLSLEINRDSVHESMAEMFGIPELLSEEEGNGWRPEKGADKVDALKGSLLRVQGLPSLLQLHLKRFSYNWQTDRMSKVNKRFCFPLNLDLEKICTDTASLSEEERLTALYDLQSVVVHTGGFGSGHYYAYVRPNVQSSEWFRFDDDRVMEVSFNDVITDAYGGGGKNVHQQGDGLLKRLFGAGGRSYGGSKSSAYMLQYVRRSDIEKLYS